jgi:hypothetical protein
VAGLTDTLPTQEMRPGMPRSSPSQPQGGWKYFYPQKCVRGWARPVEEPGTPKSAPKNLRRGSPTIAAQSARTRLSSTRAQGVFPVG